MNVQPDLRFIRYLKEAGGDTLKKCYQCATCSVRCPLSKDDSPFPRKEMIWARWGMKENLIADPDVFLCHHCGDCTTYCPRGAKPSEVLGAIRAYAYTFYGWPAGLAKLAIVGKRPADVDRHSCGDYFCALAAFRRNAYSNQRGICHSWLSAVFWHLGF